MGKHIPIRECISCHKKGEKSTFVRISKWDNEFFVDCPHQKQGRGAYICFSCIKNGDTFKKRPLDRAFRQKVPQSVYDTLMHLGEEADLCE